MTIDTVSVLLNELSVQRWEYDALRLLVENTDATITKVIVKDNGSKSTWEKLQTLLDEGVWGVYTLYQKMAKSTEYRQQIPLNETMLFNDCEIYSCKPIPSEPFGEEFPDRIIAEVEDTELTIRFGFGILKGDILGASKYGVLSYHHGDLRKYRGRPAGFWEILEGEEEVGITVQRLSETLDGGEIAAFSVIDISESTSLPQVHKRLFEASPPLLPEAVRAVEQGETRIPDHLGDLYTSPSLLPLLRYLLSNQ